MFCSKRKIPLKYFFSIETLKNNNYFKKIIIQFYELFRIFLTFIFIFMAIMVCNYHDFCQQKNFTMQISELVRCVLDFLWKRLR